MTITTEEAVLHLVALQVRIDEIMILWHRPRWSTQPLCSTAIACWTS
jgi:hypothetical protein